MNNKKYAIDRRDTHRSLDDFSRFCHSFDVHQVIAAAEKNGETLGQEKEVYALAILRALHNGDFGSDNRIARAAVSALWERGNQCGFSPESFNDVFDEFFSHW